VCRIQVNTQTTTQQQQQNGGIKYSIHKDKTKSSVYRTDKMKKYSQLYNPKGRRIPHAVSHTFIYKKSLLIGLSTLALFYIALYLHKGTAKGIFLRRIPLFILQVFALLEKKSFVLSLSRSNSNGMVCIFP
jgi:hypothetical protein